MPRSLIRISLLFLILTVVISCGGPPKKPTPPDKTTGMVVAKSTTTTDLPEAGEPEAPPRPMTIDEYIDRMMNEKEGGVPATAKVEPASVAPAKPVVPDSTAPEGVEPAKYPGAVPAKPAPTADGVEPAKYPGETPAKPAPTTEGVQPAKYPGVTPAKPAPTAEGVEPAVVQPAVPAPQQPLAQPHSLTDRRMADLEEQKRVELQYEEYLVNYYITQTSASS